MNTRAFVAASLTGLSAVAFGRNGPISPPPFVFVCEAHILQYVGVSRPHLFTSLHAKDKAQSLPKSDYGVNRRLIFF